MTVKPTDLYPSNSGFLWLSATYRENHFRTTTESATYKAFQNRERDTSVFLAGRGQPLERFVAFHDEAVDFAFAQFVQPLVRVRAGERAGLQQQRLVTADHHFVRADGLDRSVEVREGLVRNIRFSSGKHRRIRGIQFAPTDRILGIRFPPHVFCCPQCTAFPW